MTMVHIGSVDAPLNRPGLAEATFALLRRALALGLLRDRPQVDRLDLELVREIARQASAAGIGRDVALALLAEQSPARLERLIERLDEALIGSPLPDRELRQLRQTFDIDQLAQLVGASTVSLRRYLAGSRAVPDEIAARAHWLALVSADLAGAYNELGIRRWFERPRAQLGGRPPRAELGRDWNPDQPGAQRVRDLAAALAAPGAAT